MGQAYTTFGNISSMHPLRKSRIVRYSILVGTIGCSLLVYFWSDLPKHFSIEQGIESTLTGRNLLENAETTNYRPFFSVLIDGKYGFIDEEGRLVISPRFEGVTFDFVGAYASAQWNGNYGFIDRSGEWLIKPKFVAVGDFSEGLAAVYIDGKWGFVNRAGELAVQPIYDAVLPFSGGVARVGNQTMLSKIRASVADIEMDVNWKYITSDGKEVASPSQMRKTDDIEVFEKDGRYGFRQSNGITIVPPTFEHAKPYSDGLAAVKASGKYGFVDRSGAWIIPAQFDATFPFFEGIAPASLNGKWGLIKKDGSTFLPHEYDWIYPGGHGLWRVLVDGRIGYVNSSGRWVWEPRN